MEVSGASNEVAEFETASVEEVSGAIEMDSEALDEDTDVSEENRAENVDMEFETEVLENGAANIEEDHLSNSFKLTATSSKAMVWLSAAFLLLVVAAAAFLYAKQKKIPTAAKETHISSYQGRRISSPAPSGDRDLVGDSGYSIASSGLDNTFSCGQQQLTRTGEEDDDNLSRGRRPRRDSMESSFILWQFHDLRETFCKQIFLLLSYLIL